jgi:methionyl aminopeptidase
MPNYGAVAVNFEGMVVGEPMINRGTKTSNSLRRMDNLTADGKPSAHFEHDVALIDGKPEILSTFAYVYQALGIVSNEEDEFRRVPLVL